MSSVSLPVNRPMGRALVVGNAGVRAQPIEVLRRMYSFECSEADDPYAAMLELCRRRTVYNAVIVSLASFYREELGMIATVKRRFPHLEIWLTHTDGRQAALAEALKLGADGLLGDDGLHRTAPLQAAADTQTLSYTPAPERTEPEPADDAAEPGRDPEPRSTAADATMIGEPVLSADELRALLQDQPSMPPSGASSSSSSSSSEQSHGHAG